MASAPPHDRLQPRPLRRTGPIVPRPVSPPSADSAAASGRPQTPRNAALRRTAPLVVRGAQSPQGEPPPSPDALLLEPRTPAAPTLHSTGPSLWEILAHPFKSLYMLVALLVDRRVSFVRKLAFALPIALLVMGLLIPESIIGLLAGIIAPVIGLALHVPIDAAVDGLGIGLLTVALLHVFPMGIVAQYHAQLFHPPKRHHV